MDGTDPFQRWRKRLRPRLRGRPLARLRRILALCLLLAAGVLAVVPAASAGDPGLATVVSARDLPPGTALSDADLRVVSLPGPARPEGTFTAPEAVRGHLLAGAARAGEPITDVRLVGSPTLGEPGSSTVPIRLADDGVADLLRPGARVDVVTMDTAEQGRRVLATMATVVTVIAPSAPPSGNRRGPGEAGKGPLVLIAVPADTATQVAATSLGHPVTVTLR